jgi:hypothetical protein
VSPSLRALAVGLLLSLIAIPDARAGEWETLRENHERALRTHARRIAEIETRERGTESVMSEWRADGAERRKLRESFGTVQRNLERAHASLGTAIEVAESTATRVPGSGVGQKVARIEAEAKAKASWQREQDRLERERQQRERETAQRERGVR